ncbi:MAG: deoxynucleoside kinase [Flavobacteriales bacterium]
MHIAIAGNIGAGKSSLTQLLADHFNWKPQFESVEDNPYLEQFYGNMERWSFNLQIYFLQNRFQQIKDIQDGDTPVIQDRSIYEDAFIFAPNLYDMKLMSDRDFDNYKQLYNLIHSFLSAPDLLIYLKSSVPKLVEKINKRGRDCETTIEVSYLENLNTRYEKWIKTYNKGNVLILEVDELDFVGNTNHKDLILDKVKAKLEELSVNS